MTWLAAWLGVPVALSAGIVLVVTLDGVLAGVVAGEGAAAVRRSLQPFRRAALLAVQQTTRTERPDAQAWALAPGLLLGLGALMLAVVPLAPGAAVADDPHGIVLFGAAAATVLIPVFLQGWSPNSLFPLIGGYRMFAQGLSSMIPFALVLIGAALPAQSLGVGDIVADQQGLWNVVRMPLGLVVYLVTACAMVFWGPLGAPAAADLAGGIELESSGRSLLAWKAAHAAVVVGVAAMGAAVFLGGWAGPWLPGPVWVVLKTALLAGVVVAAGHVVPRVRVERYVVVAWAVLLPAALVDVFITGWWLL